VTDTAWAKMVSEHAFQEGVIRTARLNGWLTYAVLESKRPAKRTLKGWPDLTLVKPPYIIFAELKSYKGKLRPDQMEVGRQLLECACQNKYVFHAVWRPQDVDQIDEILENPEGTLIDADQE